MDETRQAEDDAARGDGDGSGGGGDRLECAASRDREQASACVAHDGTVETTTARAEDGAEDDGI